MDKKSPSLSREAVERRKQQRQLDKKRAYKKYSALRRQWASGCY